MHLYYDEYCTMMEYNQRYITYIHIISTDLAADLRKIDFLSNRTDDGFWMRRRGDLYEYIATYLENSLLFSKRPMDIIGAVRKTFELKGVGASEYYLGSDYYLSTNDDKEDMKPPVVKDVDGIAYVGHDEPDKYLAESWKKKH